MQWRDELLRRFPRLEVIPGGSYVVGGAIRDLLLSLEPADVDVAATEPLRIAERIGQRVIRLGGAEDLSAYRVVEGGHVYDVAPILDDDIVRDLARRDFTVNAMAVELANGELLDYHEGQQDLGRRVVRMVRAENFDDDPLRMLKAVRMAVRHDFVVDPATIEAIRPRAGAIASVAAERVSYELSLIFEQRQFRKAVALLAETGLDLPLFGYEFNVARYQNDEVSLAGSLALLVRDLRAFIWRWRLSETLHRQTVTLRELLERNDSMALYDAGEDVSRQLPGMLRALGRNEDAARVEGVMRGSLFAIKPLLTGEDISAATGLAPGPAVGHLKRKVLEAQVRGEVRTREEAERLIRMMKMNAE